jgi:deoxyguanosine kinase
VQAPPLQCGVPFRYIAIEGPIAVGKTRLAQRLASRLDGTTLLEDRDNPFLTDFYNERSGAALQAQLFYLLNRHRQLMAMRQADLFRTTIVCDYLFDKDKIFAYLNLDDNELFIYQRLYELLARDIAPPDLVIYLQAPVDVLMRRLKSSRTADADVEIPEPDVRYLRELNEAYQHYFFHYSATPLLVVETSQFDPDDDDALADLVRQISGIAKGTRYYVPRTRGEVS